MNFWPAELVQPAGLTLNRAGFPSLVMRRHWGAGDGMKREVDTHIPGVHLCMSWFRSSRVDSMTHTSKNFSGDSDYPSGLNVD